MSAAKSTHAIDIVIPVFAGEKTLENLMREIATLRNHSPTPGGNQFTVDRVFLVHDCGPDRSDEVIRKICGELDWVHPIWLTRNYGQHAATFAGIAATGSDWVVTLDEDGQFNPADVPEMLDTAMSSQSALVYGLPLNRPPHSPVRNALTALNKRVVAPLLIGHTFATFSSFRLILGEVARSASAYAGHGSYLDVVLSWITDRKSAVRVRYRSEGRPRSGYSAWKLFAHFWRMVLTGGTRPLRIVTVIGILSSTCGIGLAAAVVGRKFVYGYPAGFASVFVAILVFFGVLLIALGILAEYIGSISRTVMGRPLYSTRSDPEAGPFRYRS
jgi:glycosyltransferase involved in cell wall biosynthesis